MQGKATKIDTSRAEACAGVVGIITHENVPDMKTPPIVDFNNLGKGFALSDLPVMRDGTVYWDGQPMAVVVAETLEQAEYAASLVTIEYVVETPVVSFEATKAKAFLPPDVMGEPSELKIGDVKKAAKEADSKVDNVYCAPRYNHNAIEPHATIASWDESGALTVYDATQSVNLTGHTLSYVFDLKPDKVQVIAPLCGWRIRR